MEQGSLFYGAIMAVAVVSVLVWWADRVGLLGEPWCARHPPNNPNEVAHYPKTNDYQKVRLNSKNTIQL